MGRPAIPIATGTKYGRLTVVRQVPHKTKGIEYRCKCSCGKAHVVKAYNLRNGTSTSCGCLQDDNRTTMQGYSKLYPSEYFTWKSLFGRCDDPTSPYYKDYGGRGIKVCTRWAHAKLGFIRFIEDMGPRPAKGYDLDRRNNDRGYSPGNCRWATRKENSNNKRNNWPQLTYRGETLPIVDWAKRVKLEPQTIYDRVLKGWSASRAINTPSRTLQKRT